MSKRSSDRKGIARVIILIAAVLMIVAGIKCGDHKDVFGKAVLICMDCIGIG